jgi:hypothetical protein
MVISNAPLPPLLARERRFTTALARGTGRSPWVRRFVRFGLVIRGLTYFIPGAFALAWAFGRHVRPMTPAGSIDFIGQQPLGRVLLVVVAVGLAGYALWGLVRVILDPLRRGHAPAGIALRIGYAASAIAYLGLLAATVRLVIGSQAHVESGRDWIARLLALPLGVEIVVLVGLCWIFGSGIAQIVMGWRGRFVRDFALEHLGAAERHWALAVGRVGLIARGIVFTIIGILTVAGALHLYPLTDAGLVGALVSLTHPPFGRVLLAAAGLGLMSFGVFSAMCARWLRMSDATGHDAPSPPRPRPL